MTEPLLPLDQRAIEPRDEDATGVHLLPGGEKIVYVTESDGFAVMVEDPESGWKRRIASYEDPLSALSVSPDGAHLAYLLGDARNPPTERRVAWARTTAPREVGRAPGTAFGWSPDKAALYVVDPVEKGLVRHDVEKGKSKRLADVTDDGLQGYPARVVVGPEAQRIAVVGRQALRDLTEVWILSNEGMTLLTQVPGAEIHVHPIWSPGGKTIALHIAHPGQVESAIVIVQKLVGEGELYYESESVDGAIPPAWSPSSRHLAFFPEGPEGLPTLSLLDLETRALTAVLDPGEAADATCIRFADPTHIVLEGGSAAHVLTFDRPL
jgi:hypothetical protein